MHITQCFYKLSVLKIFSVKKILLLILLSASLIMKAQQDTAFWFVAPDVEANHGDNPIYLRFTTLADAATVRVYQPAVNSWTESMDIAAFSQGSINLTSHKADIENTPYATINKKGLYVTSTAPVSAYYEVAHSNNPDIFPLKGKTALGRLFYIPSQNNYPNVVVSNLNCRESFEIVATADNTSVTITVTDDITSSTGTMPAGTTFTIVLNKGETYSCRSTESAASASIAGSKISSDKEIAVTIADDSVRPGGTSGGYDLIGDQMLPSHLVGIEYIIVKGFASNYERAYILALEDNTTITLDGSATPLTTINKGQQYSLQLANNSYYLLASHPVYVYHISGHSDELGSALLPHITCTGSPEIGFFRNSSGNFAMMVLTKTDFIDAFTVNGNSTYLAAADFSTVPGTAGVWSYARKEFNSTSAVVLGANRIKNSEGLFHLGILNNLGGSSEYGYFSNYTSLYLGPDVSVCPGNSFTFDAGAGRENYLWSTGETGQTITVTEPGTYWAQVQDDLCIMSDTIELKNYVVDPISLGPDQSVCTGIEVILSLPNSYKSYLWQDGSVNATYSVVSSGSYWVRVTDANGCPATDTVEVAVNPLPTSILIKHQ